MQHSNPIHYSNLNVDQYSSFDDIKASYRNLVKKYHPDLNKSGEENFKKINNSYHWLLKNHKQNLAVPFKPRNLDDRKFEKLYRVISVSKGSASITLPKYNYEYDIKFYILTEDGFEFTLTLDKNITLPRVFEITNLPFPLTLSISWDR